MSNLSDTSGSISPEKVDRIFLYLSNEQLLDLLRQVSFLKNSIGYVEAMVVSDSLKLYVRKEMHDLQMGNIGMQPGALQTNFKACYVRCQI